MYAIPGIGSDGARRNGQAWTWIARSGVSVVGAAPTARGNLNQSKIETYRIVLRFADYRARRLGTVVSGPDSGTGLHLRGR